VLKNSPVGAIDHCCRGKKRWLKHEFSISTFSSLVYIEKEEEGEV